MEQQTSAMWAKDLTWLACPHCQSTLEAQDDAGNPWPQPTASPVPTPVVRLHTGHLTCTGCLAWFPVIRSIPRFVTTTAHGAQAAVAKTAQQFGHAWTLYAQSQPTPYDDATCADWLAPLTPEDFNNAVVLDVGTGLGGFASYAAKHGAHKVFGMDISSAVDAAHPLLATYPNLTLIQADLCHMPFRPGAFDVAFAIGVLHHTEHPKVGFKALTQVVKPHGGQALCWVYGTEGNALVRFIVEPLRKMTRHLPVNVVRHGLAWPLGWVLWGLIYTVYAKPVIHSNCTPKPWVKRLPYATYLAWLKQQGRHYAVGMITDQLIAPTTHYLSQRTLRQWLTDSLASESKLMGRNDISWTAWLRR
jgi:SAM-dependent methyltransferase